MQNGDPSCSYNSNLPGIDVDEFETFSKGFLDELTVF